MTATGVGSGRPRPPARCDGVAGSLAAGLGDLADLPGVERMFVQPASGDAGTAVGAAAYVSHARGVPVEKMEHVYLGPAYSNEDVIAACARHPNAPKWRKLDDMPQRIAKIMTGEPAGSMLRISVEGGGCSGFQYRFDLVEAGQDDDIRIENAGQAAVVDEMSLILLKGSQIDFVDDLAGAEFKVRNPNARTSCGCGVSFSI